MELGEQEKALERMGYKAAALSYDSQAVLQHFAKRKNIQYPLLSDPDSKIIQAFGILNEKATSGFSKGIPHPGAFLIDRSGIVQAKYFEEDYRERFTIAGILAGEFNQPSTHAAATAAGAHAAITTSASTGVARGGEVIRLNLVVTLQAGLHVYAPGAPEDFIPVSWTVAGVRADPARWPSPESLRVFGSTAPIPVYGAKFAVSRDVTLPQQAALEAKAADGSVTVEGVFRYQACNDRLCYPPESVPLRWTFKLEKMDRERVPAELQRKAN